MKIAIEIDEQLFAQAMRLAAELQRPLSDVIADALRQALANGSESREDHFTLPKVGVGGLRPGIDLSNSAALLDLMEGRDKDEPT